MMNADETRIELSSLMRCFKGFYLFLNTTKQIKDSSFFLTNLHLKVFDLKMICSYFPRSNRWTFLSQQRNHITHSFIIFHSILFIIYLLLLLFCTSTTVSCLYNTFSNAPECEFFTVRHEIKEMYQPSLFQLFTIIIIINIIISVYSHRYRTNLILHVFPYTDPKII